MAANLQWIIHPQSLIFIAVFNALSSIRFSHGKQDIHFTVEPINEVVILGRSVTFHCQVVMVDVTPDAVRVFIRWRGDDPSSFFDHRDLKRSILSNGSLHIVNVGPEDEGNYQCVASIDPHGSVASRLARLRVIGQVVFAEKQSQDLRVFPGQTAHFSCRPLGLTDMNISWLKDDRPIILDRARMTQMPSGSLEIDQVVVGDQGSYRCNASTVGLSKLSNKAILTVETDMVAGSYSAPPIFITRPRSAVVREGDSTSLDCAANGNPRPWLVWLKDGVAINMTDTRFVKIGTGSLQIRDIQEQDAGNYQCRAGNQEDSVDALAVIQVQVPPKFLRKPQDTISSEKKDIELGCKVYGKPEPKVVWAKDGEIITVNDYLQLSNGYNLKILGLMEMDSGIFQCMASNPAGNVQTAALLTVLSSGNVNDPNGTNSLIEDIIGERKKAIPRRIIKEQISSLQYLTSWLVAGGADATNFDSSTSPPLTPSEPRDLRTDTVSNRFVTLSWKPPLETNGKLNFYSVFYRLEGSLRERVINTSGPSIEEITIQGLQPDRLYHFRVCAYNSFGAGELSKDLQVSTSAEAHVPGPPIELSVISTSPTSLSIEWKPPSIASEDILKYRLFYMEEDSPEESYIYTTKASYELNGLKKFTEYLLWVIAENRNGPGTASEEITVKTLSDIPSDAPTNITLEAAGSTSIIVRWEPPPKDGQNGVITGYKLRYRKAKGRGFVVTAAGDRRLYAISDLEKNSTYQVRLFAMNVNGTGPPSEWYTIDTYNSDLDENQVPKEPSNLIARPSSNSIRVSWGAPKDSNVMVRGYTVGWGKGIPDDYTKVLEGKQRVFNIEDLEVNSEYVIAVRAFNNLGDGPPSYVSIRTRDELITQAPLIPPLGLKAIVLSSTTVMLYWTDTPYSKSQGGSEEKYYTVRYTWAHHTSNPRPKHLNVTELNCMINDLRPNTMYEFSVRVTVGRRESEWSMVVHNTTHEAPPSSPPRDLTVVPVYNNPGQINLNWQPPKQGNGLITGYVVFYTTDDTLSDKDWVVQSIMGDKMTAVVKGLKSGTTYHLKIQATNSKGFGPLSNKVTFTTPAQSSNHDISLFTREGKSVTSMMMIIIGCSLLAVLCVTVIVSVVCCKRAKSRRRNNTYLKGNLKLKTSMKPPDLWIHHDQMELKNLDKSHTSNSDIGPSSSGSQINTLVRGTSSHASEFDHTASLEKRTYIPNYVGTTSSNQEKTSTIKRTAKSKPMTLPMEAQTVAQPAASTAQSPGCPAYSRAQYRSHLGMDATNFEGPYSVQSGYDSIPTMQHAATLPTAYQPAMSNISCNGAAAPTDGNATLTKRQLNHPLKSFSVPAPPPQSAPSTPQQKHIVRPQQGSSPYKKSTHGVICTGSPNNTKLRTGPGTCEETAKLQASYSTEELNQEMANLEGLMKDLNAITASEFEC